MKRSRRAHRNADQKGALLLVAILALLVMVVVWTAKGDLSPKSFPGIERLRGDAAPDAGYLGQIDLRRLA